MGNCGNNKNKNESFTNSIVEKFASNDTTTTVILQLLQVDLQIIY